MTRLKLSTACQVSLACQYRIAIRPQLCISAAAFIDGLDGKGIPKPVLVYNPAAATHHGPCRGRCGLAWCWCGNDV